MTKIQVEVEKMVQEPLRASASTSPNKLAGALAGVVREKGGAEVHAIGAAAVNQVMKAVAIARGFVAPSGIDLVVRPAFLDLQVDGKTTTGMKFLVKPA
jgi:stage V sporulation protein S